MTSGPADWLSDKDLPDTEEVLLEEDETLSMPLLDESVDGPGKGLVREPTVLLDRHSGGEAEGPPGTAFRGPLPARRLRPLFLCTLALLVLTLGLALGVLVRRARYQLLQGAIKTCRGGRAMPKNQQEIDGAQVVLITGAAGNLGMAVGRAFAAQGARLALTDHDDVRLREVPAQLGLPAERHLSRAADVTRQPSVRDLCQEVLQRFGRIDVLVNVAGGFRMGRVQDTSQETWDLMMDLNARSVFNLAHEVGPAMIQRAHGRIINVGSRAALGAGEGVAVYAASKAAVLRLTEGLASELRPHGITVNSVLPSVIDTPQNRQAMPGEDFGKWVTPESVAGVILFLASDAARDISGAAVPVYGRA